MKKSHMLMFVVLLSALQIIAFQSSNLQKAKKLISEKKFKAAKVLLEQVVDINDKDSEVFSLLGQAYMGLKDYEEATEAFEEAVDLQEENANYHFWLGKAIALDAQNSNIISQAMMASDILEEFKRAIELDSTHIPGRIGVINFYIVAPSIIGGDLDKAELNAKDLVKLDEMQGRMALARIYFNQTKIDLAKAQIDILEKNFADNKSLGGVYNSLGYYYLKENKINMALEAFEKYVKVDPENANAHDSLGDGYRAAHRFDDAIAQYKKALEINPEFSASANNLKELLERIEN